MGLRKEDLVFSYFAFQSLCYITLYIALESFQKVDNLYKIINQMIASIGVIVLMAHKIELISLGYANLDNLVAIIVLLCVIYLMVSTTLDVK